jgi:hypothetical protein
MPAVVAGKCRVHSTFERPCRQLLLAGKFKHLFEFGICHAGKLLQRHPGPSACGGGWPAAGKSELQF